MLVEHTGDYDEYDIDFIMEIYNELMKHVGFEDRRRDKRFVVKFHDICYYTPVNKDGAPTEEEFWSIFDTFCMDSYYNLFDDENIDTEMMLSRMCCGHYQAFLVDILEINKENAVELAMKIYDEVGYRGKEYVDGYIKLVNNMQDLEDNYMKYWVSFLRCGEYMPEETVKEIEDRYRKDMERRHAE